MNVVYLAGPLSGCDFTEMRNWRDEVTRQVEESGKPILCASPIRGKDYLNKFAAIPQSIDHMPLCTAKGIMSRDFFDANRCAVMFINVLGATKASIGTCMEAAWAYKNHTPVIWVMEESGNPHEHPMLAQTMSFRVNNLQAGIDILLQIL